MMLNIEFQDEVTAETIRAVYRCSEFSLDYRHKLVSTKRPHSLANEINKNVGIQERREWLVIADTLVMVFCGETREMVGIDSYTNWQRWSLSKSLKIPRLSGEGRVCLAQSPEDDRVDIDVVPQYTLSDDHDLLQISLADETSETSYFRVSDRLVVGIDNGNLVTLLLQGFAIEESA